MRKLTIGVASYGNPQGLERLIRSVVKNSRTDWKMVVISNPHPDPDEDRLAASVLYDWYQAMPSRFLYHRQQMNIGYVGAVNEIIGQRFQRSPEDAGPTTEYVAYLDHDVEILSDGWDEIMAHTLDRFHEIGMIFPNGARQINRGEYSEVHWGVGCCWMIPVRVAMEVGAFDSTIGHHEEVDYQTRVRLQGLKIAMAHGVGIAHAAKASNDPASQKRISDGVIRWMNKWTAYFGGKQLNYFSPNVLRHEDWPTSALHMEEYFKQYLPDLNKTPEVVVIEGVEYDLIKVPRYKDFYRGRII